MGSFFAAVGGFHFISGWDFKKAIARSIEATHMSTMVRLTPHFATLLALVALHEDWQHPYDRAEIYHTATSQHRWIVCSLITTCLACRCSRKDI